MAKAASILMLFVACSFAGIARAARLKNRLRGLTALEAGIRALGVSMRYSRLPLAELALQNGGAFWLSLADGLKRGLSCANAWEAGMREAAETDAAFAALTGPDRALLSDYARTLGTTDLTAQQGHTDMVLERLRTVIAEADENCLRKGRVYRSMGILCGAAAAILLW